jgi:DNA polymerase-3 subunit gamma/tau
MVFYLTYRPQTIDELDASNIREALYSVLSLPEIPHAFLFTGPKGLGKTSAARILAKAVNCLAKPEPTSQDEKNSKLKVNSSKLTKAMEPCNICEQCTSITNGNSLDILEIDAASNRGIDEIRDLREKIKLSPASSRKKVYIIDEVHMLTTEAFNALLKTLEEPPKHAMFILCTTELSKVPSTIISRCFHIQFSQATRDDIARSFKRISNAEGLIITDEAITQIAELSEGGFRDAHKILEELSSMGEKSITVELIEKRYKVASSKHQLANMIESLEACNEKAAMMIIQSVVEQGMDVKQFIIQLTNTIHGLLLQKIGVEQNLNFKVQSSELTIVEMRNLLILLNKAYNEMKYAVLPQLPLELAIIEWGRLLEKNTEVKKDLSSKIQDSGEKQDLRKSAPESVKITNNDITVTTLRKQVGDIARVKSLYGEKEVVMEEKPLVKVTDFSLLNISNTEITKDWMDKFWHVYINEIKQYNHTIAGVLRSCHITKFDKKELVIETAYEFHKTKLSDGKTREILESVCKTLTGTAMKVEVVLRGA